VEDLQHKHEETDENGVGVGVTGIWDISVPANNFSRVVTLKAQKRKHIISVGFRPSDNKRHNVYPVWMIPNSEFTAWDVCFYNTEFSEVSITIYGIESN
jgi:hypothetical protein